MPSVLLAQAVCNGFGPQTPRDIDQTNGDNKRVFSLAPPSNEMNLCNIHFHNSAEHKAKDFWPIECHTSQHSVNYSRNNYVMEVGH